MKSQYILILIILSTLVVSMLLLTHTEQEQRIDSQDFWSAYFVYPTGEDNDFVIDNKSKDNFFIYKVHSGEKELQSGDIAIKSGEAKLIEVESAANTTPVTVTITDGYDEKILEKK